MRERDGQRMSREQRSSRVPNLGYYCIVTDTKETEHNYLRGLRDAIPKALQGKLVISISNARTAKLVDEACELAAESPQYREPWIVFDRDQVSDFDAIVAARKGGAFMRVGPIPVLKYGSAHTLERCLPA